MKKQIFTPLQEAEINLGYEHNLEKREVRIYAKKKFNHLQMQEIRLGFEYGLSIKEVKKYARAWIPYYQMKELREEIMLGDRANVPTIMPGGLTKDIYLYGSFVCILGIFAFGYLFQTIFTERLNLELTEEWIELDGSTPFQPEAYIQSYTKENTKLILPDKIDFRVPGQRVVLYQLLRKDEKVERLLRIRIKDDAPPILLLSETEIQLVEGEPFDCRVYIEEAYDEISGDLKEQVECSNTLTYGLERQEVLYTVQDKTGNSTTSKLYVELIPNIEES